MNKDNPTKQEVKKWVIDHIPFAIKPKSKFAKTTLVYPFSSVHAHEQVVDGLADALYAKLNNGWISVDSRLPKPLETVWITNGKGWTGLGCLAEYPEGYCWAETNGVIYQDGDDIVAECEDDNDLDVQYWHPLPKALTK